MTRRELERQFRVVDMMLTMHAVLHDKYYLRAMFLDVALVALSIGLGAFAFADQHIFPALGMSRRSAPVVLGGLSTCVLIASVVGLVVDWKGARERHGRAVEALSHLKSEGRQMLDGAGDEGGDMTDARAVETRIILASLPRIPERSFNRLKARHVRKVEVSRFLSDRPGAPAFVASGVVTMRASWRALRGSQ